MSRRKRQAIARLERQRAEIARGLPCDGCGDQTWRVSGPRCCICGLEYGEEPYPKAQFSLIGSTGGLCADQLGYGDE